MNEFGIQLVLSCFNLQFVAQALFETLEAGLTPEEFGNNAKESWIKYLKVIEENMAIGMRKAQQENEKKSK